MIGLDIKADVRQAEKLLSNLGANAVKRAAARAVNDTLTTLRADGARQIQAAHPALRISDIKALMTLKKASYNALHGSVSTSGRPLSMLLFRVKGGQQRRSGIAPLTAQIGQSRTELAAGDRKAFRIAAFGDEVFVRRTDKGRRVRRLRGPSMPGVFRAQTAHFDEIAHTRWAQTFPSRLQYEIDKAKTDATA